MTTTFRIDPQNLDFALPEELIAQEPLPERDQARLMVVNRDQNAIAHHRFSDLRMLLNENDVLVLNKAKVSPAKLKGRKKTGGRVELLLVEPTGVGADWRCLVRPQLKIGSEIILSNGDCVTLVNRNSHGENILRFEGVDPVQLMNQEGILPLPPYIKRAEADPRIEIDKNFYQTVYAQTPGSLAAPTAGLHFSEALLRDLQKRKVQIWEILLHVGWGTFKPIARTLDGHVMLSERFEITPEVYEGLKKARINKKRIIAVGTTVTRVLESLPPDDSSPVLRGQTNLFIRPGFQFRWISGLITNFHVPRSTPIALTAAFSNLPLLEQAYDRAIRERYRFFSYGDAMFIC